MNRVEKRLVVFAVIFVAVYLGAAGITLHKRFSDNETAPLRIESNVPTKAEGRLGMVQLFLPMMVLLAIAVSYAIVKKKRARQIVAMEEAEESQVEPEFRKLDSGDEPRNRG